MKKGLMAFTCALALAACATRNTEPQDATVAQPGTVQQTNTAAGANAGMQMDATTVQLIDTVYNFGTVQDGAIVEYSYRFKNTGTKPLVITNATASCGCTVPEKPEQPVLPGETGFIKVKFDTKGRVGDAVKTIHVTSNASPQFPELTLKGLVKSAGS